MQPQPTQRRPTAVSSRSRVPHLTHSSAAALEASKRAGSTSGSRGSARRSSYPCRGLSPKRALCRTLRQPSPLVGELVRRGRRERGGLVGVADQRREQTVDLRPGRRPEAGDAGAAGFELGGGHAVVGGAARSGGAGRPRARTRRRRRRGRRARCARACRGRRRCRRPRRPTGSGQGACARRTSPASPGPRRPCPGRRSARCRRRRRARVARSPRRARRPPDRGRRPRARSAGAC